MYHSPYRRRGSASVAGTRPGMPAAAHEGSAVDFLERVKKKGAEAARPGGPARDQYLAGLFEWAADTRNLLLAARWVVTRGGPAAGADGVSPADLDARTTGVLIREISRRVRDGAYAPGPLRRVEIPKPSGGTRTLSIPTAADRILQRGLLQVLQPHLDPLLPDGVVGGRPGRSTAHALALADRHTRAGRGVIVTADVRGAFDVIPRSRLLDVLRALLPDARTLDLLERIIRSGPGDRGARRGPPSRRCS